MAKQTEKTVMEYLYDYQTRLQGVANDLAIQLAALTLKTDDKLAKLMIKELPKKNADLQYEAQRIKKVIVALEKVRKPTYDAAMDLALETSASVISGASSHVAQEFNAALDAQRVKTREKRFVKELSDEQKKAILDGQGIDGATIAEWLNKWQRADLERITSLCKRASVEQMSVADITKAVRGTKENNYADGILSSAKTGAVTVARTIINGVSNNARVETIRENSDVVDGVKFVASLDGKTCPYCAPYDGQIWRGDEIDSARRPPIHPGCRCTLVPYVELKDSDGNIIDVEGERPAANADFDQLAKESYTAQAKEKGWERGWNDLPPATRLKYFYQAQKDYEKRTGNPAYRQVSSSLTFADYFKSQPEDFKRAWLGAKRYELYSKGTIDEKVIFKPDLSYRTSATNLVSVEKSLEASQISNLAKEEASAPKEPKETPISQEDLRDKTQEDIVKIPTRDQLPSQDIASKMSGDILEARDQLNSVLSQRYQPIFQQEIDALLRANAHVPGYQQSKEYEERKQEIFLKVERLSEADRVEHFEEIYKPALDILLPVNQKDSLNRQYAAKLFDDRIAVAGLPEHLRDSFNRTFQAALDYAGRICDNLGVDLETVIGRIPFRIKNDQKLLGGYDILGHAISLNLNAFATSKQDACAQLFSTIVHEIGHAVDHKIAGGQSLIKELSEEITTDKNGNQSPTIIVAQNRDSGYDLQIPNISVPRLYTTRKYSGGGTEITSTFFETFAKRPTRLLREVPINENTDWQTWDKKDYGCREFGMRVTDVFREAMRFQKDKNSILEGAAPKETLAIMNSLLEKINNAEDADELRRLQKTFEVRKEAWEDVKRGSKPSRRDLDDDEEYDIVSRIWNDLVKDTNDKVKEVADALKRRLQEFGISIDKPKGKKSSRQTKSNHDVLESPALPASTSGYTPVPISWVIHYANGIITFNSIEEISYVQLIKIPDIDSLQLDPVAEGDKLEKKIKLRQPFQKDYPSDAEFKVAETQWNENRAQNDAFWKKAAQELSTASHWQWAKYTQYPWESAEFQYQDSSVGLGLIIDEGDPITDTIFASLTEKDINDALQSLPIQQQNTLNAISSIPEPNDWNGKYYKTFKGENTKATVRFYDDIEKHLKAALAKIQQAKQQSSAQNKSAKTNGQNNSVTVSSTKASFRGVFEIDKLNLIWIEMTYRQLDKEETLELKNAEQEWKQVIASAKPATSAPEYAQWEADSASGTTFWAEASKLLKSLIKSKTQLIKDNAKSKTEFPTLDKLASLEFVDFVPGTKGTEDETKIWKDPKGKLYKTKDAGGSTGAQIIEMPDGAKFIMKKSGQGQINTDALRNECAADGFYRALGVRVPEFSYEEDSNGNSVKFSRFIDGGITPIDEWMEAHHIGDEKWLQSHPEDAAAINLMRSKIREHFGVDVLMGNWDAVGDWDKNIVIDKDGNPWRIDNGCSMGFRGSGEKKDTAFWGRVDQKTGKVHAFIDDMWTMTGQSLQGNGQRIGNYYDNVSLMEYFGDYDILQIANQIDGYRELPEMKKALAQLAKVSPDDRKIIEKRLEEVRQVALRGNEHLQNGFTREFALEVIDYTYVYSKDGLREGTDVSVKMTEDSASCGWLRYCGGPKQSTPEWNLDKKILSTFYKAIEEINDHTDFSKGTVNTKYIDRNILNKAVALRQDLLDALQQGKTNAQHYIDLIDKIIYSYKNAVPLPPTHFAYVHVQPNPEDITTQYPSMSDYMRSRMGDEAVDFIERCNGAQGADSYIEESCYTKIIKLRQLGVDIRKFADFDELRNYVISHNMGVYLGDPQKPGAQTAHYDSIKKAFDYYKDPQKLAEYDKRCSEMAQYHSGNQLLYENSTFTGNDHKSRSIFLMRTEDDGVPTTTTIGEASYHDRGLNESFSVRNAVVYQGGHLTVTRTPYCRCYGNFLLKDQMFLGDDEHEISACTNGLPAIYMGQVKAGDEWTGFKDDFLKYEKKLAKQP